VLVGKAGGGCRGGRTGGGVKTSVLLPAPVSSSPQPRAPKRLYSCSFRFVATRGGSWWEKSYHFAMRLGKKLASLLLLWVDLFG
jgi:hypothetical protein